MNGNGPGYAIGYFAGRMTVKAVKLYFFARMVENGYKKIDKISKIHKIESENPEAVTENVFSCLKYID